MVPTMTPDSPPRAHDVQPLLEHIGTFLRHERDLQGRGLETVAALAGLSKSHLGYFETGERDISLGRFLKLLHTLGVSITDVLPPEGPSVLADLVLLLHARGPTFCDRQKALLEATPDCVGRKRS